MGCSNSDLVMLPWVLACAAAILQHTGVSGHQQTHGTTSGPVHFIKVASMAAGLLGAFRCLASDELRGDVQGLRSVAFSTQVSDCGDSEH